MARRPILVYGAPELRRKARPVARVDAEVRQLIDDMVETMYAAPGVGLAANQVGALLRVIVANPSETKDPGELVALVNPRIALGEGEQVGEEGCLSLPDIRDEVARYERVVVRALDRDGKPVAVEGKDLLARILQHEIDHLDGILFIDRLAPARREALKPRLRQLAESRRP
jgi:peptide deformylase